MEVGRIVRGTLLCITLSIIFVASLYIWDRIDPKSARLSRDNPKLIKRRTLSVVVSSIIAGAVTWVYGGNLDFGAPSATSMGLTALQITFLMIGPISDQRSKLAKRPRIDLAFLRTVIVAPIFEEFVFRLCFHEILTVSGYSLNAALIVSPLLFAAAHVHHHWSSCTNSQIAGQVVHTCVFGWLGGYLLVTRSLWDAILAHAICNYIGLPSYSKSPRLIRLSLYAVGLVTFLGSIFWL